MNKLTECKDWKELERIVQDKDESGFIDLMNYWRKIGEEHAFNDTYADVHLLSEKPYQNTNEESAQYNKLLCDLQLLEYEDSDLYKKARDMLIQAVTDGAESRVKKLSRFIYLLGVRQSMGQIREQIDGCLSTIKDKRGNALVKVIELQEKIGFIPKKESKDEK